jgi:myo-inositol-1(or 4)-monophosphatase
MTIDAWELVDFGVGVAREAGRLLMDKLPLGRWRGQGVEHKAGRELVSQVDRAAEGIILRRIRHRFPDHAIQAEESGEHENGASAGYRWIVDPLDGTTNFLHGHPMFAVSIAVERIVDDAPAPADIVAAVVYLPYFSEIFIAAKGEGAFLNSRSIRLGVSQTTELADALVTTGFAYDRERYPNYDNFVRVAHESRGIRRCGAAAIDLAYVAAGRYDAFWELGLKAHDVAAGALLVREAGGRIGDFGGGPGWLRAGQLIATNEHLFEPLQELLEPAHPEGDPEGDREAGS